MKNSRNSTEKNRYSSLTAYICVMIAVASLGVFAVLNLETVIAFLSRLMGTLSPLIVGFVIAYLVNPFMKLIEEKLLSRIPLRIDVKLRRILAIIVSYVFYIGVIVLLMLIVIPQMINSYEDLMSKADSYIASVQTFIVSTLGKLSFIDTAKLTKSAGEFISNSYELINSITPYITSFLTGLFGTVQDIIIGTVISVYFLFAKERFADRSKKLVRALLPERAAETFIDYAVFSDKTFGGFIVGKLLDSLIIGIITFITLMIVGIPHYQLISVIIGVTNIIPFFGPILGLIPSAFFVLIADPAKLILFVIIVIIIQQLDGNVIGPKILGDSIGISSLGVIIAITVMSDLLGVVGMFIGVPLYVLITSILRKLLGRLETTRRSAAVGVTDGVSDASEDIGDKDNSEISEEGADASETDGQCTDDLQTVQQKDSAGNAKDGKNENGGEVNGR